jgi:2-dehydro-3-deoxygalactonokinase
MDLFREHRYRNAMIGPVAWIAVDWGTSNLRAWAMDDEGQAIANAASEAGMARLSRDDFEPTLLSVVDGWLTSGRKTRIVACGMVGARQGWMEAAYASVPCTPLHKPSRRSAATLGLKCTSWAASGNFTHPT